MIKLLLVAGARPNFMKIAPIVHELRRRYGTAGRHEPAGQLGTVQTAGPGQPADGSGAKAKAEAGADVAWRVVHTGQHYDFEMSRTFFEELELDAPDHFLNVGSASHAEQAARVMTAFEPVCLAERPDRVVVVGDVNSTMACALVAVKLGVPVAHVEAGLRSFDRAMPEEINRLVTDAVADLLLVSEPSGLANLEREGRAGNARFVGNVMIDALHFGLRKLEGRELPAHPAPRAVVTLHRPSNVDTQRQLGALLDVLAEIGRDMTVFFPIHPRTRKNIDAFGLAGRLAGADVRLLPPLPYLEFLHLWRGAALVLTDSGGIQEETTALGVPCFTLRDTTERPVTVDEGTNVLVGASAEKLRAAYAAFRGGAVKRGRVPELWDGRAAGRIVDALIGG